MHDSDSEFLSRTTNVKEKLPDKRSSSSHNLTMEELQSLNAGDWFLKVRALLRYLLVRTFPSFSTLWLQWCITWLSRRILSIRCPSSQRTRGKRLGIRPYPLCSSCSTSPSSTTSQWYSTFTVPTRKLTPTTQSAPSWILVSTHAWYVLCFVSVVFSFNMRLCCWQTCFRLVCPTVRVLWTQYLQLLTKYHLFTLGRNVYLDSRINWLYWSVVKGQRSKVKGTWPHKTCFCLLNVGSDHFDLKMNWLDFWVKGHSDLIRVWK